MHLLISLPVFKVKFADVGVKTAGFKSFPVTTVTAPRPDDRDLAFNRVTEAASSPWDRNI